MEIDSCDAKRSSVSQDVSIAQIVTAITTVFYAAVFAIGYYMMIRGNREVLQEMREERLSGGRPQVIVERSLLNLPLVEFVVPHVSGGAAKDITFEVSDPIEQAFSKIKSYLREACARSQDKLMEIIGEALSTITASDAEGFFEHCGYRAVVQSL